MVDYYYYYFSIDKLWWYKEYYINLMHGLHGDDQLPEWTYSWLLTSCESLQSTNSNLLQIIVAHSNHLCTLVKYINH